MFFLISKTAGLLIEPYYLGLTLLALAGLLRLLGRAARLRRWLVGGAGLWVLLFAFGPTANLLLYPLESACDRPAAPLPRVGAVILLGGMISEPEKSPADYELQGSGDRLVEAIRLSHRHPEALLLITGGSSSLLNDAFREADILGTLARELGIAPSRLRIDRDSRNTRENAEFSQRLLGGVRGPYLLVTSAAHMPRALASFRKLGLPVTPWPVDFLRTGSGPGSWLPKPQTLLRSNAALHEYAGWLAYWAAGYI